MAMASRHAPPVEHVIESIELPAVHLPPTVATLTSNEPKAFEPLPQVLAEPVQRRSTFRTFTVMIALFVSISCIF